MTDVYKKVGRGGAGNFYSKKDVENVSKATTASDLEAQDIARAISASQPRPEFIHSGRGGAGNWLKPSDLESQGITQDSSNSIDPTSVTPSSPAQTTNGIAISKRVLGGSKPTYRGGRGGAGNYTDFEAEERARKEEEERLRIEMESRIERDVEAGLVRPPKAYGGIGGVWEMGDMK